MKTKISKNYALGRCLAYMAFAGGIIDILFWALYLSGVIELGPAGGVAEDFESAFLFADMFLGGILIVSGIGLLKSKGYGSVFLLVAASMAIYLGILDITFYARQGLYLPITGSSLFEIAINAFCLLGGVTGVILSSKIRSAQNKIS